MLDKLGGYKENQNDGDILSIRFDVSRDMHNEVRKSIDQLAQCFNDQNIHYYGAYFENDYGVIIGKMPMPDVFIGPSAYVFANWFAGQENEFILNDTESLLNGKSIFDF